MKIGINGFGRIGRLVFRALWDRADIEITHINEYLCINSVLYICSLSSNHDIHEQS